jgi:hypothetical protein
MKTNRNVALLLTVAVMVISLIGTSAWAKKGGSKSETQCGLAGTWQGEEPNDMVWMAIHTSNNADGTKGEMLMNWVYINPSLLFSAASLSPGHGAWQRKSNGKYDYTWYAYGLNSSGEPIYLVRVRGVATIDSSDCDTANITYSYDIFEPAISIKDSYEATPNGSITGEASETRVPLVPVPTE